MMYLKKSVLLYLLFIVTIISCFDMQAQNEKQQDTTTKIALIWNNSLIGEAGMSFQGFFQFGFKAEYHNIWFGISANTWSKVKGKKYENISLSSHLDDVVEAGLDSTGFNACLGYGFDFYERHKIACCVIFGVLIEKEYQNRQDDMNILGDSYGEYYVLSDGFYTFDYGGSLIYLYSISSFEVLSITGTWSKCFKLGAMLGVGFSF